MRRKYVLCVLCVLLCLLSLFAASDMSKETGAVNAYLTEQFSLFADTFAENISIRSLQKSFAHIEEPSYVDWYVYREYYECLTEKEKLAYRCIYNQIFGQPERIAVPFLQTEELNAVFSALRYDNPQLLLLDAQATLLTSGMKCYFVPTYTMSYWQARTQLEESVAAARELLAEIPENASDYDILLAAHDALLANCVYEDTGYAALCSGALLDGKATCAGYTEALKLMLDLAGVQSCTVTGNATDADGKTVGHMWLAVNTDGIWSFCDPTWNDPVTADGTQISEHGFFGLDEARLSQTHRDIEMPHHIVCNTVQTDYFRMQNLYCTMSDYEQITAEGITAAVLNRKAAAEFRFDTLQTMQTACEWLIDEDRIYDLLKDNAHLWPSLVTDSIRYSANEDRLILKLVFCFEE